MSKDAQITLTNGLVALVDAEDYARVVAFRWSAMRSSTGHFYATANPKGADGKRTTLYMHRLITGAPKGKEVDHLNRDTLDNRRVNLRVGSHRDNMQNGHFALKTHCPQGHPYDAHNTYFDARGRRCRRCAYERNARVFEAETPAQRVTRLAKKQAYYERTRCVQRTYTKRATDVPRLRSPTTH